MEDEWILYQSRFMFFRPESPFSRTTRAEGEKSRTREEGGRTQEHRSNSEPPIEDNCSKNIKFLYTNANSLYNKLNELKTAIKLYNVSIICVTETHFDTDILEAEIEIPGFLCFRGDRTFAISASQDEFSEGRGSIIYIKAGLNPTQIDNFTAPDSVAIRFNCYVGEVVVACVYRSTSLNQAQNSTLMSGIKTLCEDYASSELIIAGDLNLPDVDWVSGTVVGPVNTTNKKLCLESEYIDLAAELGLVWHIYDEITRRRLVDGVLQESTLDQIFTSNDAMIEEVSVKSPLGKSDHVCLLASLNISINKESKFVKATKDLWSKMSHECLLESSKNIDWSYSSENLSVEEMWGETHEKLMSITAQVPKISVNKTSDNQSNAWVPWGNSAFKRNRRAKDKQWAVFDSNPTPVNLNLALDRQHKYEKSECAAKIKYERKITQNLKTNSKSFFSYLRSKRKVNCTVSSLQKDDGTKTMGATDTASVLANFFSSVFTDEPQGPLPESCFKSRGSTFPIGNVNIVDRNQ